MTTPATPTDAEMEQAAIIIATAAQTNVPNWVGFAVDLVAQALADQRARYEALADELTAQVKPRSFHPAGTHSDGASAAYEDAAERIRQVGQR